MSLVEEYYELNETEKVSTVWKTLQIGFYACAACLGLGCGFTLAISRSSFDDRCYLFTEVKTSYLRDDKADHTNIIWENDTWCDYYQFTMVSSFIVAIIWATFFLMCGKGGRSLTGLPKPWRIVWPSLIFNFIYLVIVLCTAIDIQKGTDLFCGRKNFDKIYPMKSLLERCEPLKVLLKEKNLYKISIQLEIVVKTSWGCVISWFILFLLSFFRIVFVVDFNLYKICVFKINETAQNKKEEVLRITNYEEPKKLHNQEKVEKLSHLESDETLEDLEAGTRKKKIDKKTIRHYFNTMYRSPLQQNAAFYVTADIRMLKREKKGDKYSKALGEAFGKKILEAELKKSTLDFSGKSNIPIFLYQRSRDLNKVRNDDDDDDDDGDYESSSSSKLSRINFIKDYKESASKNEFFVDDLESNFLMTKKQI